MIDFTTGAASSATFGLQWPLWVTVASLVLLAVVIVYVVALLLNADRLLSPLRHLRPQTIRGRMIAGVTFAAALPALCVALVLAERASDERLTRTTQLLQRQAERINENFEFFLRSVTTQMIAIAARVPDEFDTEPLRSEAWLVDQHRDTDIGVSDLVLVEPSASVIATSRIVESRPVAAPASEASLANRPFFYFPMTSPAPYLSDAIQDPDINARARAVISVPIRGESTRSRGVLMGTISATHFEAIERRMMVDRGMGILIHDRNGDSVFASGTIGARADKEASGAADGEVFGFSDASSGGDNAQRFVAAGFTLDSGWRVYVYQPLLELESALLWDYLIIGLGLCVAIVLSMLLARKLAEGYSGPLLALDRAIGEFDLNMSSKPAMLPEPTPGEIRSIFHSLQLLDNRLRTAYGKLRNSVHQGEKLRGELIYVIANREKEIKKRTEELKEANETLERLSREDSLTGLANRRWFAEFLARTWRRAIREKQPVSVLIIDIDNFKAYNDTYGHQKGDMCLKLVAEAIRRSVGRATDLVSRYGGEEFIVVLGDTPLDGALKIAEEIRASVENLEIPHEGSEYHEVVTVSIGATSTLPSADMQPETFLVAADRAMYRAKNDGKNQVAYSTSSRTGVYQALCLPDGGEKRLS